MNVMRVSHRKYGEFRESTKSRAAISDINSMGSQIMNGHKVLIADESVTISVSSYNGYVWLNCIESQNKNSGAASRVLSRILDIAKKYNVRVGLMPEAYGQPPRLTTSMLIDWYTRYGFTMRRTGVMIYDPYVE